MLGDTLVRFTTHQYGNVRSAMLLDAQSTTEKNSVGFLPAPTSGVPIVDINGVRNDNLITMSSANAKALSLGTGYDPTYGAPPASGADARIRFNTNFASDFDYDQTNGIAGNKVDFVGVATHEIGHALGFSSLTDIQDGNPGFVLHPSTLDLWRFRRIIEGESDIALHSLPNAIRQVTADPAEYYDNVLDGHFPEYTPLASGVDFFEGAPRCNTNSGRCQASHWRDDQGLLMDTPLASGVLAQPANADKHAIDYIGYGRNLTFAVAWEDWVIKWFDASQMGAFPADECFVEFAVPEAPGRIEPPFDPDLVAQIGLNLGVEGMKNRGGTAFVRFQDGGKNSDPRMIAFGPTEDGVQDLNPRTGRVVTLPPAITDFYFESENEAGEKFVFTDNFAEGGVPLDPSLGEFGGYVLSGFIDGLGVGAVVWKYTGRLILAMAGNVICFILLKLTVKMTTPDDDLGEPSGRA